MVVVVVVVVVLLIVVLVVVVVVIVVAASGGSILFPGAIPLAAGRGRRISIYGIFHSQLGFPQSTGLFWFTTPRDSATRREKVQNGPQGRRTSEGVDRLKRAA